MVLWSITKILASSTVPEIVRGVSIARRISEASKRGIAQTFIYNRVKQGITAETIWKELMGRGLAYLKGQFLGDFNQYRQVYELAKELARSKPTKTITESYHVKTGLHYRRNYTYRIKLIGRDEKGRFTGQNQWITIESRSARSKSQLQSRANAILKSDKWGNYGRLTSKSYGIGEIHAFKR